MGARKAMGTWSWVRRSNASRRPVLPLMLPSSTLSLQGRYVPSWLTLGRQSEVWLGNRCLVEKKSGQDPGKCYDIASSFKKKNDVKLLSITTQLCTKWSKGSLQRHVFMSCKNSQNPLWRVFHLWFIWVCLLLYFPRLMLCYFFSLVMFLLCTNTQSLQEEKYYLLVCSRKVFSNPRCLNW